MNSSDASEQHGADMRQGASMRDRADNEHAADMRYDAVYAQWRSECVSRYGCIDEPAPWPKEVRQGGSRGEGDDQHHDCVLFLKRSNGARPADEHAFLRNACC